MHGERSQRRHWNAHIDPVVKCQADGCDWVSDDDYKDYDDYDDYCDYDDYNDFDDYDDYDDYKYYV